MVVILGLSLVSTALGLLQPYLTKFLIDDGLIAQRLDVIIWICLFMVTIGLGATGLGALNRWYYVDVSARMLFALREAVFGHLQRLSPSFHARARGGDLLARLDGDIAEIQRFAVDSLLALINGLIALLGALALMVTLSWRLSLLALILLPVNVFFLRHIRPRIEHLTRTARERASDITAFFFERLSAVKFIQSVAAEDREEQQLATLHQTLPPRLAAAANDELYGQRRAHGPDLGKHGNRLYCRRVLHRSGRLVRGYAHRLLRVSCPGDGAGSDAARLVRRHATSPRQPAACHGADRDRSSVTPSRTPTALPTGAAGAIRLDNVSFRYDPDGPEILKDASIDIPAGKKVGLGGISGVGKTTLIDLLHHHYDPQQGRIFLGGVDLRELELPELRRRVAVVAQDTMLFSGTVLDNIRYAAPDAPDSAVRQAAAMAEVDEFADAFPRGYETDVGARGAALSGGQRQRIAIARALLQDPLVLILDEAASAVDREAEARITVAIDRLFSERTRLIISHRPQTLAGADLIFDLIDGRLVGRPPTAAGAVGP